METIVLNRPQSTILVNRATLVAAPQEADCAGLDWAVGKASPYIQWIGGNFVEADKPNSNNQFWTAGDLEMAEYTIKYSPLNMIHKWRNPIGFFAETRSVSLDRASLDVDEDEVDTYSIADMRELSDALAAEGVDVEWVGADHPDEAKAPSGANAPYEIVKRGPKKFQVVNNAGEVKATFKTRTAARDYQAALYRNVPGASKRAAKIKWTGKAKNRDPMTKKDKAARDGGMKIQALAGLWKHIFPMEARMVEMASESSDLFYSMECVGSHLRCAGPVGCGREFAYADVESHCAHLQQRTSVRHIVNPVFRGGAIIIPPTRPGWTGATATVIDPHLMREAAAFAEYSERQYEAASADGEMTTSAWEQLMAMAIGAHS